MKILFVTGGSHNPDNRNLNHHQRTYFLSRQAQLTILGRKGADFSVSAKPGTTVVYCPVSGTTALLLYGCWWVLTVGRRERFDIVLTEPSKLCLIGALFRLISKVKWVVDVWDIPIRLQSHDLWPRLVNHVERFLLKQAFRLSDLFIVSIVPDHELKYFHIPERKMALFQNAIWLEDARKKKNGSRANTDETFQILCMRSRYSMDSGLDLLGEAFLRLRSSGRDAKLTIVGMVPSDIEDQVQSLRGQSEVVFHDFVPHQTLLSMIREASVCVIPYRESIDLMQIYPVKVLEYLALGAVLLVPRLDGITRMVHDGLNGLVFRAGDSHDMYEKFVRLYDDPNLRTLLSKNAQKLSPEHDCQVKAENILRVLASTLNKKPISDEARGCVSAQTSAKRDREIMPE